LSLKKGFLSFFEPKKLPFSRLKKAQKNLQTAQKRSKRLKKSSKQLKKAQKSSKSLSLPTPVYYRKVNKIELV
jgi:hypothetical protein